MAPPGKNPSDAHGCEVTDGVEMRCKIPKIAISMQTVAMCIAILDDIELFTVA